jgi:hypothetical protein
VTRAEPPGIRDPLVAHTLDGRGRNGTYSTRYSALLMVRMAFRHRSGDVPVNCRKQRLKLETEL